MRRRSILAGQGTYVDNYLVGRSNRNQAAFYEGSSSSGPVEPQDEGCDPTAKDIHEEIQPPVGSGDIYYPKLLVDIVSKVVAVEKARKIGAEDGEIKVLEEQAASAFLDLESQHGIRVAEHSVFGPLYRRLRSYETSVESRMKVEAAVR